MDIENENKRLGFGTQDRPTGGVVPAPGESSSCDGLTAGLPTGPAVELATVRIEPEVNAPGADDLAPVTKKQGEPGVAAPSPLLEGRKELRLCLDPREVDAVASTSAEDSAAPGSASFGRVLRSGRGLRILEVKKHPSERNIKVVASEIVNSPVPTGSGSAGGGPNLVRVAGVADHTVPPSSDEWMSVDCAGSRVGSPSLASTSVGVDGELSSSFDDIPHKGKKRGRKPKGSNAPGSHAVSRMSSKRLECDDDEWDGEGFCSLSNKKLQGLKKRRGLVECNLDDRLTAAQKTAVEEVTGLFPQMSPKSMVVDTLRKLDIAGDAERKTQSMNGALRRQIKVGINVAKVAVQQLLAVIDKSAEPTDVIRANNLALEEEVAKLRKEMDSLRSERASLKKEVETLQRKVRAMGVGGRGRDRTPSSDETAPLCDSPVSRRSRGRSLRVRGPNGGVSGEARPPVMPPAFRPPLGGVRKNLDDVPRRLTGVDGSGRIVDLSRAISGAGLDSRAVRTVSAVATAGAQRMEPSTRVVDGEPWTVAGSKRARRKAKKKRRTVAAVAKGDGSVVPPPPVTGTDDGRRAVTNSGAGKTSELSYAAAAAGVTGDRGRAVATRPAAQGPRAVPSRPVRKESRLRAPRSAAVLLRSVATEGNTEPSYAEVVRLARGKISLEDLNIANTRLRKAQAGGLLIEIPGGDEAGAKAEALVDRLRAVLAESEYKDRISVVRPVRRAEIRLVNVDQSVSAEEVVKEVATFGEVSTGDVRIGPFRQGRGDMNTVWVQCPLACATKLVKAGRIRLGWSIASVVALAKRRLQCFRCLAVGHTRVVCQSAVDRSAWCFQCGGDDGHRAAGCRLPPRCPVCADRGLAAGHRAGAVECVPFNGRGRASEGVNRGAGTSVGVDRGALAEEETMEIENGDTGPDKH